MLNEFLKKQRDALVQEIKIKDDLVKEKMAIQNELDRLEKEFKESEKILRIKLGEYQRLEKMKKTSPFKSFIKEKFSNKYRNNMSSIKDELRKYRDDIVILRSQIESKEYEYNVIKEKLSIFVAKEKELSLLEDEEYAIKKLLDNDPTVIEYDDVMIDLIVRNMEYICIDKKESPEVYFYLISEARKVFMQKIGDFEYKKNKILRNIDYYDEKERKTKINEMQEYDTWIHEYEGYCKSLSFMSDELSKPRNASSGKYKIPHTFLFEAIRKHILFVKEDAYKYGREFNEEIIALAIAEMCGKYKEMDCKFPLSFGNKIERLYMDESTDLYLHDIYSLNEGFVNEIFQNGLYLRKEYNCSLDRTTVAQYQNCGNYFTFLNAGNSDKILLSIPKEDTFILGNNFPDDNMYILPKYVVGEIKLDSGKPVFIENNIPLDKRTIYDNVYIAITDKNEGEISISKHR